MRGYYDSSKGIFTQINEYVPRSKHDIGPTVGFEWHNIQGSNGTEFLKNLKKEQGGQFPCCFLESGFIKAGRLYEWLTFLDLVNGGIVVIHEEEIYDMTLVDGGTGKIHRN